MYYIGRTMIRAATFEEDDMGIQHDTLNNYYEHMDFLFETIVNRFMKQNFSKQELEKFNQSSTMALKLQLNKPIKVYAVVIETNYYKKSHT